MVNTPSTDLVTTRESDAVTPLSATGGLPNLKENFAQNADVKAWVDANLAPLIITAINDGDGIREEWLRVRRMTLLQHDRKGYNGQSKAFVPSYAKAASTKVSHQAKSLFPSDQYLDVSAVRDEDGPYVEECKAWMHYQLERKAKLRAEIKPFLRQLNDYGVSVAKAWWEQPITKPMTGGLQRMGDLLRPTFKPNANCSGVRFKTRDMFSWYIWPNSARTVEEATLVFESVVVDKQTFDRMFKTGRWVNQEAIGEQAGTDDESETYRQAINDALLHNTATAVNSVGGDLARASIVHECWIRMPLPKAAYAEGEEVGEPIPAKVVMANGVPVEVTRNPFWHQQPPYLFQTLESRPDNFYGLGIGRMGLELQTLLNDFTNQTNDVARYGLNPIVKMNPSLMVGPTPSLGPGKVFNMTDPNAMQFDRPPVEIIQWGMMMANSIGAQISDLTGAPPVLQGTGSRGAAKTATGSQILQGNAKLDIQADVEETEIQVLIPLMEMAYALGQQYESDEVWLAVTGGKSIRVSRAMFYGQYMFRWMASTQTANQQMRAQQTLMFLQSLPAILPMLQAQGKTVDPIPVLRRFYADGIGGRDFDAIIKDQPMPLPGAPQMPGAPGVSGAGPEPRSAVEQAAGGSAGLVEGEGDDFMAMRQEVENGPDQQFAEMMAQGGV